MLQQVKKSLVLFIYFALAVSTLLVFWQVKNFDFVNYDDNDYVYQNSHVLNGLTFDNIKWAFTAVDAANWHPLTWLSLMLDCQLFRDSAGRIHLVNVLLHLLNTLLLFAVLKKITGALWPSAFVAALFALHPMHVESVAWIAERKDVLSTLFWILTIAAYYRYIKRPTVARYLLALLVFALGLMAKPMLITLPFVFLLLDYWPLERISRFSRQIIYHLILEKIPFFVLSVVSGVITFLVQRRGGVMVDIEAISLDNRIANVFLSYAQYITKMFWPANLAVFYPFNTASLSFSNVSMSVMLLLAISFFVVRYGRSQKYLPVGWLWFLGTLIPVIGIVQVGSQAYADRYTYVPYTGLFIIIAWGFSSFLSKQKIILGLLMVIVLTDLGMSAHRQARYWGGSFTLFTHAIDITQNNWLAYNNLGVAYNYIGRYPDAMEQFSQAVKIRPRYADARNNLGVTYGGVGRFAEAMEQFSQAIKIKPDYAEAYANLGIAYHKLGRFAEAIDADKQAIKIKPDYVEAHKNLGIAYLAIGDKNSAVEEYKILMTLDVQTANKLLNQINK
jgi:protein O-mannosyl-transferase